MPDDCFRESPGDRVPSNHWRRDSKRPIGKKGCELRQAAFPREPNRSLQSPEPQEGDRSNNCRPSMSPVAAHPHLLRSATLETSPEPFSQRNAHGPNIQRHGRLGDRGSGWCRPFPNSRPPNANDPGANAHDGQSRATHGGRHQPKKRTHRCPAASTQSFVFLGHTPSSLETLRSGCHRILGSFISRTKGPRNTKSHSFGRWNTDYPNQDPGSL